MTHAPARPQWTCSGCGDPWPCRTARLRLRAEFDGAPISLALYLGAQFVRAAYDLRDVPAGTLHARFLGWTRTPRHL